MADTLSFGFWVLGLGFRVNSLGFTQRASRRAALRMLGGRRPCQAETRGGTVLQAWGTLGIPVI